MQKMDSRYSRKIVLFFVVLVLAGGAMIWYFYSQKQSGVLTASGTMEATEVVVSSKVIGKVMAIKFEEGAKVVEGDILAEIEAPELQAGLKSAQAKYKMAQDDFKRSRQLFTDKMISPQQYDAANSALEIASAGLETAKIQNENTIIEAPISGTVLVKAIEAGELALLGTPITTLADLTDMKLTVYLPEKDMGKVSLGEEVSISVDSYPGEKFKGKVIYISEKVEFTPKSIQTKEERTTQVFAIKIKIPNLEQKLKPGMPADAEFTWNSQ